MAAPWIKLLLQILLLLVSSRHIHTKTPGPTPAPLDPVTPLPTDVRTAIFKGESQTEKIELLSPVNLSLECTWAGNQNKPQNITGYWIKDGVEVENSRLTVELENQQYNLKRMFSVVDEASLGNYSCAFGNEAKIDFILTAPQIGDVRDKPIVSYVGDSTVITCKMDETKPKPTTWNWYKANGTEIEQISATSDPQRYQIKVDKWKTRLVVYKLTEADSGVYHCGAVYPISTAMSHVELKVITIMEPLKPFIAILIEVVILVAAILLYEKTQSKKPVTADNEANAEDKNSVPQVEDNGLEGSSSTRQRKV